LISLISGKRPRSFRDQMTFPSTRTSNTPPVVSGVSVMEPSSAAADELDAQALEHVDLPPDPAQERRGEQARHRAADDDGAPAAAA